MNGTGVTKKDVQEIINKEWKDCEELFSAFAESKGMSLETLEKHRILIKPSVELVVWNCNGLWKDEVNRADEDSILRGFSAKIAGKVLGRIYKGGCKA